MTWVLLDFVRRFGFEVAAFLPDLGCFITSTSWLLEPYLFSGSSSSSAAQEGPDCSSSPTKYRYRYKRIETNNGSLKKSQAVSAKK